MTKLLEDIIMEALEKVRRALDPCQSDFVLMDGPE